MIVRVKPFRFLLLAICLSLTFLATWVVKNIAESRSIEVFQTLTTDNLTALNERLKSYAQSLNAMTGLFVASDQVTKEDVTNYVSHIDPEKNFPGLTGLGLVVPARQSTLPAFLEKLRAEGVTELDIHPDSNADEKMVVQYLEPSDDPQGMLGLDIAFDDDLRQDAIDARDSGQTRITKTLRLDEKADTQPIFLMFHPVYRASMPTDTEAQRQQAFFGWVFGRIVGSRLLRVLTLYQDDLFEVSVFDGSAIDPDRLIYGTQRPDGMHDELYSVTKTVDMFGRDWTIHWESTPKFEAAQPFRAPYVILIVGLGITGLFDLIIFLLSRNERKFLTQVREKSSALKTSEDEYRSVFEKAHVGILTLDAGGVVMRANETAVTTLGRDEDLIVGQVIDSILPELDIALNEGKCFNAPGPSGVERVLDYRQTQWRTAEGKLRRTILLLDVTEQENHLTKIRETEKRWNLALKGAQIGVFDIDLTTGKSVVSDNWRRLMGVELEDEEFDPQTVFMSRVHPDDREMLRASDAACIRGETVRSSARYRVRFNDNEWRWMQSDATVVDWDSDGRALRYVGAQTDVTDQMIAQNALALSEERFRLVFFHAPVGKAIAVGRHRFTAVNEAMCNFLGYTEEELLTSVRLRDVLDRKDLADIFAEIDARRDAGESAMQAEKQFILRDGTKSWGLISISWTVDENLGDLLFIVQINDISEVKEMERTKSEFVSTISHELRTPLTSIRGALELMSSTELADLPDKRKRLLDIARQNSDRLLQLVNDVLDLERIESRQFEFQYSDESIAELLEEGCEINMPMAQKLRQTLVIEQADPDTFVNVDRNRFGQVLSNLISNACKFSEPDNVVRISAVEEGAFVKVSVTNRGAGIPDSFRQRVFQPFSQADGTDTRKVGGTGLGLNIAKQIVERMGGQIGFASVVNQETTFWFTCPRA